MNGKRLFQVEVRAEDVRIVQVKSFWLDLMIWLHAIPSLRRSGIQQKMVV